MNHPHLLHRGTVRALDHPVLGQFKVPANPLRFSEGLPPPPSQAPMLGEHNREVLRHHIGMADDQLAALELAGVLVADERLA
ncbi:MAG: CoA transferase [Alphaproteobacteria bacterium]|nr:CoA transferase [Alphaproteobacteria bacterium]